MGCDEHKDDTLYDTMVSTHAPVWGAIKGQTTSIQNVEFQHTHPYGVRCK